MKFINLILIAFLVVSSPTIQFVMAQKTSGSMLDGLDSSSEETVYAKYSFKTDRVVNLHSLETTAAGVMDVKISHRFGPIDNGFYDLFGLDAATQRIGIDYGVSDDISIGINRNSLDKAYDAFGTFKFLKQSSGKITMPITAIFLASIAVRTEKFYDATIVNSLTNRLYYTYQFILGRKFDETFSFELAPTFIHRNLVTVGTESNNIFALGVGGRIKLSKRIALTGEYVYVLPNQIDKQFYNSASIGVDIETGGHVFQFHFTNSPSMSEYAFITENTKQFGSAQSIRFGFNIARVFTVRGSKKSPTNQ